MKRHRSKKSKRRLTLFISSALIVGISCFSLYKLQSEKHVTVKANMINVRRYPSENSAIVTQKLQGASLKVLKEENRWYEVQLDNGTEGWVASWLLDEKGELQNKKQKAYIIEPTPLYENYYKQSNVMATLNRHDTITILQQKYDWAFVKTNRDYGWIPAQSFSEMAQTPNKVKSAESTQKISPKVLYVRQKNTKLRQSPSTTSAIVTSLDAGTKVSTLKNKTNGWYYVETATGEKGYIADWLLSHENLSQSHKKVRSLKDATIVLDAGHGGYDSGSVSTSDKYEKDATLQTTKRVKAALEKQGAKVIMTRNNDKFVGLEERAQISNRNKADAFICIHFDSTKNHNQATGTTTYYYHDNSRELANDLNQQLMKLPLPNRGVEFGDHQVTRDNNEPAVLLELGYMSNDHDVSLIFSKSYQEQIADAIVAGLTKYFSQNATLNTLSST